LSFHLGAEVNTLMDLHLSANSSKKD